MIQLMVEGFDFCTSAEMAENWNVTGRWVAELCSNGSIDGAVKKGNTWLIPSGAEKPIDGRMIRFDPHFGKKVKPFVKWAGGKGQLLEKIRENFPSEFGKSIKKYAEPFVGGGAVFFDIIGEYDLESVYISDINKELITVYRTIKSTPEQLISALEKLQNEYLPLDSEGRSKVFYQKRERYNKLILLEEGKRNSVEVSSLFIFLNRTCFNGLYRVNSKGLFNVPSGRYKTPLICDAENISSISPLLEKVEIVCGDYRKSLDFIDSNTFAYFDPPYRPINITSSFTSYSKDLFHDDDQRNLAEYARKLSSIGAKVMISNSDPKNNDSGDDFFDALYSDFNIKRIEARRNINSDGKKRGKVSEILVMNY